MGEWKWSLARALYYPGEVLGFLGGVCVILAIGAFGAALGAVVAAQLTWDTLREEAAYLRDQLRAGPER